MFKYLIAKTLTASLFTASLLLIFALQINAQQNTPPANSATVNKSDEDLQNADVSITANVTARELRFEIVPKSTVEFPGKPERKNVWEADRQNLPQSVEPGVTYRNIGIRLRIASRFADIERIVAEALGEIPVSDNMPANQLPPPGSTGLTARKSQPKKQKAAGKRSK